MNVNNSIVNKSVHWLRINSLLSMRAIHFSEYLHTRKYQIHRRFSMAQTVQWPARSRMRKERFESQKRDKKRQKKKGEQTRTMQLVSLQINEVINVHKSGTIWDTAQLSTKLLRIAESHIHTLTLILVSLLLRFLWCHFARFISVFFEWRKKFAIQIAFFWFQKCSNIFWSLLLDVLMSYYIA